eukprot:Gb_20272 [translate_table: standard]
MAEEKFKYFKGFLRDAGGKRRHDESVNDWVREIEDVAYDAEDILEECLVAQDLGYSQFLFRCRMGRRIKDVKDRIKSIHEDAIGLKLFHDVLHQTLPEDNVRGSGQTFWKTYSLLVNESQTVGMEEKIEMIIVWLNDTQTRVIAVVSEEEHSDVACGFVNELIDRCLVEVSEEETLDSSGIKRYLKMHDLLRDLCHSISEKETRSLCDAGKGSSEFPNPQLCHGRRRILQRENCARILPDQKNECPGLRTLLLSGNKEIAKIPASFISKLKSLRVLDLPESVRGLRSLQVLDVSGCRSLKRLPEGIGELKYLRHLTADGSLLQFMPRGVSKLSYMEKLMEVELKAENGLRLEDFKGLTQLRHLKIIMTNDVEMEMTWILGGLVKMQTLCLWNASKYDAPHLSEKMASLKELEILYLCGFAVPNRVYGFHNLVLLELYECDWNCRRFGKAEGFPKLERFHLSALNLEELPKLENGAMPRLKSFTVFDCKMPSKIPDGMELLTSLEEISLENCEEWKAMKAGGEDWKKLEDNDVIY